METTINANNKITNAIQPLIESLESRRLISASLSGTQLNVDGTSRSDDITVDIDDTGLISVSINGRTNEFDAFDIATLRVRGLGGNDHLELTSQFDMTLVASGGSSGVWAVHGLLTGAQ